MLNLCAFPIQLDLESNIGLGNIGVNVFISGIMPLSSVNLNIEKYPTVKRV